jgi:CBS domain containing-hemolysin-like protein
MNEFIIIIITLIASAFFSGMEIAFVSSDKLRLELDKNKSPLNAKIINKFLETPGQFIATMLVGNNIALVVYSLSFAAVLDRQMSAFSMSESLRLLVQTIISTLIILTVAEFLPKTIFKFKNNQALNLLSVPAAFFYYLFYPITRFSIRVSKFTLKRFFNAEIGPKQEQRVFGKTDLDHFLGEMENFHGTNQHVVDNEIKLFKNALDFSKIKIRDCMIPRPDIELIEINAGIDQLKQKFIETGFSKILVFKEKSDNIIGYAHSSDLFNNPQNIEACLRKVSFVPETMEANKLLSKLLREHKSTALVVDEFGGIAGMITTEDILEEIFGEIEDEHDTPNIVSKKVKENHFILSGRLSVDEINEAYNTNLLEDNSYETLAGYLLFHHPSFPKANAILIIGKYEFKILRCSKTRIELVEMKLAGSI